MQIEELILPDSASVLEAMRRLDETGMNVLFLAPGGRLEAVMTDADVRRFLLRGGDLSGSVREMANYQPKSLPMERRSEAREMLLRHNIGALPLLDKSGCILDVEFAGSLDIDTHKKACLPVVIMAGGLGTRLYPYTKILPKPLIPIGERPIVEHIMQRFVDVGCTDFRMVVNYKKNMIKSYFNDLEKPYDITFVDEEVFLGTGGGLSLLKGALHEPFFLTNCDILIDADYGDIYQYHKTSGNLITMVCAVKHFTIPYGVIDLGPDGQIEKVTEKPEMNFLTNTGVYVVEPRVVEELAEGQSIGFPDIMERYRAAGQRVGVYPISENSWMDMGQLEELDNMRRRMEQR